MASLPSNWRSRNCWQLACNWVAPNNNNGDCGPSSVAVALDIASISDFDAGLRPYPGSATTRGALIVKIRSRGGSPSDRTRGTSVHNDIRAFLSFGPEFAAVNRRPPGCTRYEPGDFDTGLKPDLQNGKWAMVGVAYSPIQNYSNGSLDGCPGCVIPGHMVVIGNLHTINGTDYVTLLDPLADGRRAGIPKGANDIPLSVMRTACGQYTFEGGGTGKVSGMTFAPRDIITAVGSGTTITAISVAVAGVTTVTTAAAHGLVTGDWITATGTNSTPALTGPYQVTLVDTTHFRVAVNVTGAGTAGTWADSSDPGSVGVEIPVQPCSFTGAPV